MINLENCTTGQISSITHDKGNLLVSASAGSGKTMVVIQRILRLITQKGVSVDNILAVTFTNAAASEMKDKLKSEIIELLSEKNDEFLKEQLDKISTASISTIHSFCNDLIKRYFYVIGLDASVKLIDEKETDKLAGEAMANLFDRLYEEANENFYEALSYFTTKRRDDNLRKHVLKLYEFCDGESDFDSVYNATKNTHDNVWNLLLNSVFNRAKKELNLVEEQLLDIIPLFSDDEKRKEMAGILVDKIKFLQNCATPKEFIEADKNTAYTMPRNAKKNEEACAKLTNANNALKIICSTVSDTFTKGEDGIKQDAEKSFNIISKLIWLSKEFKLEFEKIKAENNVLDFSDLQKYAILLLQKEEILKEVKSRYEYIFIDEYQDVNDLQENLINLIASDNLFMVGDSKQSIYAFRGCNPKFFIEKFKKYNDKIGGDAVSLDNNFRSSEAVINTVNTIFSDVFTEEFSGLNYAKTPMVYGGLYNEYKGKAVYHLINDKEKEEKDVNLKGVYSVIDNYKPNTKKEYGEEEVLVINLINSLKGTKYYDIKEKDVNKRYKEYTYGDICILSRSNSKMAQKVLSALSDSGIPISVGGKNSIGDYPEIQVMISLTSALCFISQDIPLATIMLNLWDFTEEELALIREKGGKYVSFYNCIKNLANDSSDIGVKINNFLTNFERLRVISEFCSANEILTKIVSETEWDAKLLSEPLGKEKLQRVERFIAESILGDNKMNIKEFNDYIEKSIEDITVTQTTGENSVKFMTEHSSKGLEFPCVIIVGTDTEYNSQDVRSGVLYDREYGVVSKIYNPDTMIVEDSPVASLIKSEYSYKRAVEEARVLYVALTRAKCELHVIARSKNVKAVRDASAFVKASRPSDFLSLNDCECIFYNAEDLNLCIEKEGVSVAGNVTNENLSKMIRENLTYTYPHIKDTVIPLKTSVSDVNRGDEEEYYKTINIFDGESAERGTAYHKIMELINFYSNDLESELNSVLNSGKLTSKELELIDKDRVLSILNMDIFKQIKGYKLSKERRFYCLVNGEKLGYDTNEKILVQGVIDLFAESDEGIVLIDYKLSQIVSEEDLVKKYSKQMALYKEAIETISHKKVLKTYLVNILQNKTIEIV